MLRTIKQISVILLVAGVIWAQGCAEPVSGSETVPGEAETTQIDLNGSQVAIEGPGARWEKPVVSITAGGVYEIRGASDNVSFLIDSREDEPVHLVLDGVEIASTAASAIVCEEAEALVISSAPGSENVIQDMGSGGPVEESQEDRNALVHSEAELTFQGSGRLTLVASYHAGVQAPRLTFAGGTMEVRANRTGILTEGSLILENASLFVYSQEVGMAADGETGIIRLNGGSLELTSFLDGLYGENAVYITGGDHQIVAGGGTAAFGQEMGPRGIAAGTLLQITGGSIQVDSLDYCLYSEGNMLLEGGKLDLQAGSEDPVFPSVNGMGEE